MNGKIVKGGDASDEGKKLSAPGGKRVIKREVHTAREAGKEILGKAEEEARRIVEEAKAEADRMRAEAKEAGYEDGISKLNELLLQFQEKQAKLFENSREEILRLSVKIAEKILGRELAENEEAITDVVIRAMRGIAHEKRIQIRVHPDDLNRVRKARARLLDEVGPGKEIELREDRNVSAGGCIVETDLGIIDAQLATQLRVLERALLSRKPG